MDVNRLPTLLFLAACGTPGADRLADARALPAALAAVENAPDQAVSICAPLKTAEARGDCVLHGVERLARKDADTAATMCAALSGLDADECFFQVAERSGDVARCAAAGRFAEDCRMHAWTARVPKLGDADTSGAEWGRRIAEAAAEMGFAADDERPWIAAARTVLGRSMPLDRSMCAEWPFREVCERGGLGLLHDRINHVRDAKKWDCTGPPPDLLAIAPEDSELQAVLDARKGEMCP